MGNSWVFHVSPTLATNHTINWINPTNPINVERSINKLDTSAIVLDCILYTLYSTEMVATHALLLKYHPIAEPAILPYPNRSSFLVCEALQRLWCLNGKLTRGIGTQSLCAVLTVVICTVQLCCCCYLLHKIENVHASIFDCMSAMETRKWVILCILSPQYGDLSGSIKQNAQFVGLQLPAKP